ncbi:MAG TPA: hypothetical protein VFC42_13105 [Methylomirabilota bacterium]|jgi:hypothetical protein|nr:hypothetical protein [Methylomirabilota bacterium]
MQRFLAACARLMVLGIGLGIAFAGFALVEVPWSGRLADHPVVAVDLILTGGVTAWIGVALLWELARGGWPPPRARS